VLLHPSVRSGPVVSTNRIVNGRCGGIASRSPVRADLVHVNEEGTVMRIGESLPTVHVPLNAEVIAELTASGRLAPETTYSLQSAWAHRAQLLDG
jgi:hypothetical protein